MLKDISFLILFFIFLHKRTKIIIIISYFNIEINIQIVNKQKDSSQFVLSYKESICIPEKIIWFF